MSATAEFDCPRGDCMGLVTVTLEWEAPESNYGADADGNRGIYVAGYWSADVADTCSLGCIGGWTEKEVADFEHDAISDAPTRDDADDRFDEDPREYDWGCQCRCADVCRC